MQGLLRELKPGSTEEVAMVTATLHMQAKGRTSRAQPLLTWQPPPRQHQWHPNRTEGQIHQSQPNCPEPPPLQPRGSRHGRPHGLPDRPVNIGNGWVVRSKLLSPTEE